MHSFLSKDRRSIIFLQKKTSLNVCIFSPNETNIFLLQKLICLKDFSIASLIFFLNSKENTHPNETYTRITFKKVILEKKYHPKSLRKT